MTDITMPHGRAQQRPTLLTIICVLSAIAGLWGLWGGVQNAFTGKADRELAEAEAKMEEVRGQLQGQPGGAFAERMMDSAMELARKAAENAKPMGYASIALALLSLFGVWHMWNLRRSGFWYYLLAAIGSLLVPVVFLGGGLMTVLSVGFFGLITIVFVILYAVNLKHMH
ncbi:MAG: hypothetical protein H6595_03295 [Flavobacteriales bacterium]|nr:hypothetical protein [Flavobacteriales bacterium]MCB9166483.1 hypothetical protein [Flavobacteriales bacterium]